MKTTIPYIRRVIDRLERRGWPQWRIQIAFETLRDRYNAKELTYDR